MGTTGLQLATYGGIIALITLLFSSGERLKNFMVAVQNLWLSRSILDEHLTSAVYNYCFKEMRLFGLRTQVFSSCLLPVANKIDDQLIGFDVYKQSALCFRKGIRFLVMKPGEWRFDESTSNYYRTIDLFLPRIMWSSEKFIKTALNAYNDAGVFRNDRFNIVRFYGKNKTAPTLTLDDSKKTDFAISGARKLLEETTLSRARIINENGNILRYSNFRNPFDWYSYPEEIMDIVENTRHWYRNRAWYTARHIPWRRGWLIHGPAGTGKTVLAKCIAQDLNMPIFVFDIASMDNVEFEQYWRDAQFHNPCMVLIEDFDAVFHGRENVVETAASKLTFDCMLNCISGVEGSDGILFVITTNHVEHVDKSLGVSDGSMSTRPGRIDDVLYLGPMVETCRRVMAGRILGVTGDMLEQVVTQTDGMTSAQFTEFCNKRALQFVVTKDHKVPAVPMEV